MCGHVLNPTECELRVYAIAWHVMKFTWHSGPPHSPALMCPKPGVPESNKFLQVQVKARLRRMFSPKLINARLELLYEECDNKQCSTNYDCLADTSKYD